MLWGPNMLGIQMKRRRRRQASIMHHHGQRRRRNDNNKTKNKNNNARRHSQPTKKKLPWLQVGPATLDLNPDWAKVSGKRQTSVEEAGISHSDLACDIAGEMATSTSIQTTEVEGVKFFSNEHESPYEAKPLVDAVITISAHGCSWKKTRQDPQDQHRVHTLTYIPVHWAKSSNIVAFPPTLDNCYKTLAKVKQ